MVSWLLVAGIVTLLGLVYREYRWSVETTNLKEIVIELNKELDSVLNVVWIDAVASGYQGICNQDNPNGNDEKSCSPKEYQNKYQTIEELQTMITKYRDEIIKKVHLNVKTTMLKHVPSLFNLSVSSSYEIYSCHHGVLYTESDEAKSWIKNDNLYFGNRQYRRYIAGKLPLSNFMIFFVIAIGGIIPWCNFGWISKEYYIAFVLRLVLHWFMMSKLALWIYNFAGIIRYLPPTYAEYKKKLTSLEWWKWLLQKIFFAEPVVHTVVRYIVALYITIPWFYYYFYRQLCTRTKDDLGDSWFLLNTLTSIAFLYTISYFIRLVAFGTPSMMTRMIGLSDTRLFILIIITIIGFIIMCLRSVYFLWGSSCSWVGTAITWIFLHTYFVELLEAYSILFILFGKIQHNLKRKEVYIAKFNELIKLLSPLEDKARVDESEDDQSIRDNASDELRRELSRRLYDAFIYKSMRDYILGVGVVTNDNREERMEAEKKAGNGEGKSNSDDELDKVFNLHVLILHNEIYEKLQNMPKDSGLVDMSSSFESMMSDYLGVHL